MANLMKKFKLEMEVEYSPVESFGAQEEFNERVLADWNAKMKELIFHSDSKHGVELSSHGKPELKPIG